MRPRNRTDVLSSEPFDLVICRRVACTIESDDEFAEVLKDLRALVSDDGRALVTVCDPHCKRRCKSRPR